MAETEETLPRATVQKIIKEKPMRDCSKLLFTKKFPCNADETSKITEILTDETNDPSTKEFSCAKETVDLIGSACLEFIRIISDMANDKCEEDKKKTIAPEHIMSALEELGWEDYVPQLEETWREDRARDKQIREKQQKAKDANNKLTDEEMLAQQEKLFAQSRALFSQGPS